MCWTDHSQDSAEICQCDIGWKCPTPMYVCDHWRDHWPYHPVGFCFIVLHDATAGRHTILMYSKVLNMCSIISWNGRLLYTLTSGLVNFFSGKKWLFSVQFIEQRSNPFPSTFGPVAHSVCMMTAQGFERYCKDISYFVFLSSLQMRDKITALYQSVACYCFNLII